MQDWEVPCEKPYCLGFEGDSNVTLLDLYADIDDYENWSLVLDVEKDGQANIINLLRQGKVFSVLLDSSMLADDGVYTMQVRGTNGDKVKHSNKFYAKVNDSINAEDMFPPEIPSEFTQIEKQVKEYSTHPPIPGQNGYWLIWDSLEQDYVESEYELPEGGGGGIGYKIGSGLHIINGDTLAVNTSNKPEQDNTLPITSSAVFETVGNIEVLLGTI